VTVSPHRYVAALCLGLAAANVVRGSALLALGAAAVVSAVVVAADAPPPAALVAVVALVGWWWGSARLDALELTMLIARKDSSRYPRVATRWPQRLLEEHPDVAIEEAALAASCLVALPGAGFREAALTLEVMAESVTRRRRERGVA
jgi:hypothetical protein